MSSFFRSIRRRIPIILITRFHTNHQRVRAEHRKRIQKRLKQKLRTSVHNKSQSERIRKIKPRLSWNQIDIRKMSLFVIIAFFGLMLLTSAQSFVQFQWHLSSDTLKKWTAHMSAETFVSALSMEIPQLTTYMNAEGIEAPKASHIAVEMVTSFNPEDPRSLIRREIPGFAFFDGEIVSSGEGVNYTDIPIESSPPLDIVMAQREAVIEEEESAGEEGAAEENADEAPDRGKAGTEEDTQTSLTTGERDVVYIYHTHNRESWIPHIPSATTADEAFHDEVNITMVGERLGEELERRGIGTEVDTTDIGRELEAAGLGFAQSYVKSREVVETAMMENDDITFMFDLHRDSVAEKERTTVEIDGEEYARTMIVVGKQNPNYEQNKAFAKELEEKIEELYPGLNRMIYMPEKGNGEYNQSLFDNNVLIEIGGVSNTLEESYRTAEALADVISDLYWDAEAVDAEAE